MVIVRFIFPVTSRPGGDLLSRVLRQSTIGAEGFHGRVRDGIGWGALAMTTRSARNRVGFVRCVGCVLFAVYVCGFAAARERMDQAGRAISKAKLHALLRFHTPPINVVVYHGSSGNACLEGGFPLRCFQRLSLPYIATRLCHWRDNRCTRGMFIPVLSY